MWIVQFLSKAASLFEGINIKFKLLLKWKIVFVSLTKIKIHWHFILFQADGI